MKARREKVRNVFPGGGPRLACLVFSPVSHLAPKFPVPYRNRDPGRFLGEAAQQSPAVVAGTDDD
jgi:hypothetical protein